MVPSSVNFHVEALLVSLSSSIVTVRIGDCMFPKDLSMAAKMILN